MNYVIKDIPEDLFKRVKATAKAKRQSVNAFFKEAIHEHRVRLLKELTEEGRKDKHASPGRIFLNCQHDEDAIGFCCSSCFTASLVSAMKLVPPEARPKSGVLLKEFFRGGKRPLWAKEFLKIAERP